MAERTRKSGKTAGPNLTQELASFLGKRLLPDLAQRARDRDVEAALRKSHAYEQSKSRTADSFNDWVEHLVEQVGAAWILSCVFIRTLEDRELLAVRRLAGPGAADSVQLFFEMFPALTRRDYLLCVFREISRLPGAEALLGPEQNPAWRLSPSQEVARALCEFFEQTDDSGGLRWHFDGQDTRFLGDLYQDLSASVRERYALLQTPHFIERFILDLTLEPAIAYFGLDEVRLIDPTCGSGHFLLGAFERLFEHHQRKAPMRSDKEHAQAALKQIYGADLNPYAVAIARFRLTLAYLEKTKIRKLAAAPALSLHLVVADSLLYGARNRTWELGQESDDPAAFGATYLLEDPRAAKELFKQSFHAIVGNPPYITCKDSALRDEYRKHYPKSAAGKYALVAPFTECFFGLAVTDGFVGLINANSFMKREFGKKLIEEFLKYKELTRVIDTSGAFIPGHGTPTALLFGRNSPRSAATVRTVQGKRGEPEVPKDPEQGKVWSSIERHYDEIEHEDEFISVADVSRETFDRHPWSLGGGGASELKGTLETLPNKTLSALVEEIGFASFTGLDDIFILPSSTVQTQQLEPDVVRPMVVGESVRDWTCSPQEFAIVPYDGKTQEPIPIAPNKQWARFLWPYRTCAEQVISFGGKTRKEEGQNWWEWYRWQKNRYLAPFLLCFGEVATHNHFVLDRGGKVFKQTAPIIKLPEGSSEEDHLALLGYLNSSTACFWMKQVAHKKTAASQQHHTDPARATYSFSGTALGKLPIPPLNDPRLAKISARLLELGEERTRWLSGQQFRQELGKHTSLVEIQTYLDEGWRIYEEATARAVYWQDEIDWLIYSLIGLCEPAGEEIEVEYATPPGSRPFEHESGYDAGVSERARKQGMARASVSRPAHWNKRIAHLAQDGIRLIETREFKRQWRDTELNIDQLQFRRQSEREWLERWILENVEEVVRSSGGTLSVRNIVSQLLAGKFAGSIRAVADFLKADLETLIPSLVATEAVPYLAAYRYSVSGMENRRDWESVWDMQRREDAGETLEKPIPVPPKYDPKDFRDPIYYRLRGKLDVPKERFISYPGAERADDRSPVIGWAGWNHLERARALAELYQLRKQQEGWEPARLKPLLAGVRELLPWLKQWHNEPSEELGGERPGEAFAAFLAGELRALGLSEQDLDTIEQPTRTPAKTARPKAATTKKRKTDDHDRPA